MSISLLAGRPAPLTALVNVLRLITAYYTIRSAGIHMAVDPLGGAGVHYWAAIAERWKLDLTVVSEEVDPTFAFMPLDWDGQIRMDPSSSYAMQRLIGLKDRYDVAFACDPDHDRHGIVTSSDGSLGFAGEESAGASFLRQDGSVWTADKDGLVPALLSAEIMARTGRDPGALHRDLVRELGESVADRVEASATAEQKARLAKLSPTQVLSTELAGEKIDSVLDHAPGNQAPIGGIKVTAASGWFAARPSGTEAIYKIYAESFKDEAHLRLILQQAQQIVDAALKRH